MENKITNKIALEFVLALEEVKQNAPIQEKIVKMLEQVEKKSNSGKDGKPTKTQLENEKIKEYIIDVLSANDKPMQIKEMLTTDILKVYSNQKISALLRQLIADKEVVRTEEKKVAYFGLAPIEVTE